MMTLNPSKRRTLDYILKGPWLNMGQEKEPWPKASHPGATWTPSNRDNEEPGIWVGRDPGIGKYNTYLILISCTEYKVKSHTIGETWHSPDPNSCRPSPAREVVPSERRPKSLPFTCPAWSQGQPPLTQRSRVAFHPQQRQCGGAQREPTTKTPSMLSSLMVDPRSPSGQSGPAGVARRVFSFLLRLMHCKPSTNEQHVKLI